MSIVTNTTSWGSRAGNSFKGILAGILIVVVAIAVLFWNEGRTIKRTKALKEVAKVAVSVDPQTIDDANEGKPIHTSGDVVTEDVVSDPEFGISLKALRLDRKVEMYQWQEDTDTDTRRTSGGGQEEVTSYSYQRVWSEELIDSSSFHEAGHDNPKTMPYSSQSFPAQNVTLGAFSLTKEQIDALGPNVDYNLNQSSSDAKGAPQTEGNAPDSVTVPAPDQPKPAENEEATPSPAKDVNAYRPANIGERFAQDFSVSTSPNTSDLNISTDGAAAQTPAIDSGSNVQLKLYGNGYYIGDPSHTEIGDVRITFSFVETPCPTSFVGQQHGNTLIPYQAKTGSVLLQTPGIHSLEEMITSAQKENKLIAWIVRALGLFFIFIGIKVILAPLVVLADFIPFAGRIIGFGTDVVAFCGTLFLGLGTISIGWIYYRPLVGIPLLVIAVGALVYPFVRNKKKEVSITSTDQTV